MSILLEDLNDTIIGFMELPEIVNLMCTNKYYYGKIRCNQLIIEWNKTKKYWKCNLNYIFGYTCSKGYITYAKSLLFRYKIDIHCDREYAFQISCHNGNFGVAKWLIDLGENHGYNKINIHHDNDLAFLWSYRRGHFEIAKWLIDLGKNYGYGKIDQELIDKYIKSKK